MPPVPVHIDDPITSQKAPSRTPTATTTQPSLPSASPAAAAFPAPTSHVSAPQPQPQPTRTTRTSQYGPPPPQPGAVPVPPSQQAPMTAASLPPPPKAGEAAQQRASVTTMPPQMALPPPSQNYAPTHGTLPNAPTSTSTPSRAGPTTINFGAVPQPPTAAPQHPPGYQQDVYAQEMSSAQRASLDQQERRESAAANPILGLPTGGGDGAGDTAGQVWNAVKGWANVAGSKLEETHSEVWKRINRNGKGSGL